MTGPQPRATHERPANATLAYSFRLHQNRRAFWLLQIFSTGLFFLFGWFFSWWTLRLRPTFIQEGAFDVTASRLVLVLLVSASISIVLHELIHGACFWIFSRARPVFGFRIWYAYAAAPGWFFPRWQYLVIGLAPFLLLSALGMLLLPIVPVGTLFAVLFGTVANAAGASGDLWTIWMLIRERRQIMVEDLGDGFNFYALS